MLGLGLSLPTRAVLGAGGFSPASLFAAGEVGAWYDPSDLTTLFQDTAGTTPVTAAGQRVALMRDKSGRGNDATQSVLAQRPTYQVDAGGRPYLEFDGIDDGMLTGTITPNADKVAVFAGVRKVSDANAGMVLELSASTAANAGAFYLTAPELTGASSNFTFKTRGSVNPALYANSGTFLAPVSAVLVGLGDIAGDTATIRTNGTPVVYSADQGTGNLLAYPLYIGRRGGATIPFNGHLYGAIVRFASANLAAAQIAATERWLNSKTGAF